MIVAEVLSWWYAVGWMRLVHGVGRRIDTTLEYFSVGLLFKTLFDPFRQIDAGRVRGSMQDEWRAFGNRTVSRFVGAVIRTFVIFAGLISTLAIAVVGLLQVVAWPLVPLVPLIGLGLMLVGWTP